MVGLILLRVTKAGLTPISQMRRLRLTEVNCVSFKSLRPVRLTQEREKENAGLR